MSIPASEALGMMSQLVVMTNGWDDASVEMTARRIADKWPNREATRLALEEVVENWSNPGRPPWAVLHEAYKNSVRRLALAGPALPAVTPGRVLSVAEGRRVAMNSYAAECSRRDPDTDVLIQKGFRGTEPTPEILDHWLGIKEDADD